MALLIIGLDKHIGNAKAWRAAFAEQLPRLEVRTWPDVGDVADIKYLAFMHPDFDALPTFPNLRAMFSRAAGVESFIRHPKLPKVPLGKVEPPGGHPMMTEYVLMHVLRLHRDMPGYQISQTKREWRRAPIARPEERRIGFLGYGMMAQAPGAGVEVARLQGLGLGAKSLAGCRGPHIPRSGSVGAVSQSDRYRSLPVAAYERNRGHLLCPYVCNDA